MTSLYGDASFPLTSAQGSAKQEIGKGIVGNDAISRACPEIEDAASEPICPFYHWETQYMSLSILGVFRTAKQNLGKSPQVLCLVP